MTTPWGAIMSGIGTTLSAAGQAYAADAAYGAAKLEASQLEAQAVLAEEEAKVNEDRQRRMSYKVLSSARAALGASGVTIEGSALDVLEEGAMNAELDALLIRHAGKVKAITYRNQAQLARFEGKTRRVAGHLGAAGSVFSSAGQGMGMMGGGG